MFYKKLTAVTLTLFIVASFNAGNVHAGEVADDPNASIPYDLSYPGLLPDHPLYVLKLVRDNVMTMLIGKPIEKSSFMLLQSDKYVSASKLLLQKNDINLVHESLISAQKYYDEAIECFNDAKKEGLATQEAKDKLENASKKHHEIIHEIVREIGEDERKLFEEIDKKAEKNMKIAASLRP